MRKPERLNEFYDELKRMHMTYFPDWRFGQFMMNFFERVMIKEKIDPFFPEEDEMLSYLKDFCGERGDSDRDK